MTEYNLFIELIAVVPTTIALARLPIYGKNRKIKTSLTIFADD